MAVPCRLTTPVRPMLYAPSLPRRSEVKAEEAAVLHYTYARFDDVVTRRGRCNCGNSDEEARSTALPCAPARYLQVHLQGSL